MADFRKLFLALAVLALMALPLSAQLSQLTCNTSPTVPALIRAEGVTEQVGDLVISCTGPEGTATANVSIRVALTGGGGNVNVTSKRTAGTSNQLDAVLIMNENYAAPIRGTLVPYATGLHQGNTVLWENITIPVQVPAGSAALTFRISNIRANATGLGATHSTGLIDVLGTITVEPSSALPLQSPGVVVARATPGLATTQVGAYRPVDLSKESTSFLVCVGASDDAVATVSFHENFGSAFKVEGPGRTFAGQTDRFGNGEVINVEEGLIIPTVSDIGTVSTGTRLYATFTGIPEGVTLAVDRASIGTAYAQFVSQDPTSDDGTPNPTGSAHVTLTRTSDGTSTAVWEIVDRDTDVAGVKLNTETATFTVYVTFDAGLNFSSLPTPFVNVTGGFATVDGDVNAEPLSVAPIPRFVDREQPAQEFFQINACVTNLLFPYVVNIAGFDTGVAIANTSLDTDVFDTDTQHGPCTVYYFGTTAEGPAPAPQTTRDIAAGEYEAFTLGSGGVSGATSSAATFAGYMIARCNFQFAHGFAFITDGFGGGGRGLAQGYLALVIPERDGGRLAQAFSRGAAENDGEQLAQ